MIELASEWKKIDLGNEVTVEIKPLNLRAYHRVMALMMPHMVDGKVAKDASTKMMMDKELPDILGDIIPPHVQNVEGIQLNGEKITSQEMLNHGQMLPQCITIMSELLTYSSLTGEEEKN